MFVCGFCNTQSKAGVPSTLVVVAIRSKTYSARNNDPGGVGHETVQEVQACLPCGAMDRGCLVV